jgi:uncharacterized protein YjiS (DUF1127 family)
MTNASYARHSHHGSQKVPFEEFVEPTRFVGEVFYNASEALTKMATQVFKETLAKARAQASIKELSALSDHSLKDIGVDRSEIRELARRVAENPDTDYRVLRSW